MAKFCGKCGSQVDENGKCPKCDSTLEMPKNTPEIKPDSAPMNEQLKAPKVVPQAKETKPKADFKKKAKMTFIITIIVLSVYTVSLITLGTLVYFNKLNIPFMNDIFVYMGMKEEKINERPLIDEPEIDEPTDEPVDDPTVTDDDTMKGKYKVTPKDADAYFAKNSTVSSEVMAQESADTHSESDAYKNFEERGFAGNSIITNYDMMGGYSEAKEISSYSSTKHPMYQTVYLTPNGVYWQVFEINGAVMAYRFSETNAQPVILSETNTITSYDSAKNKFYINTPNNSVAKIMTVDRIDADTLDSLN